MIDKIRKDISLINNKKVYITVNNIRNKKEIFKGTITEVYNRIFIVLGDDNLIRSFNYSDVLVGNVEIKK